MRREDVIAQLVTPSHLLGINKELAKLSYIVDIRLARPTRATPCTRLLASILWGTSP
jgi:hypothetical protein